MKTKIGRNDLCPCGSGTKYKKCCLMVAEDDNPVKSWIDDDPVRYWIEDDGIHIEGHFAPISSEDLKILTKEYQEIIRDSPLCVGGALEEPKAAELSRCILEIG